MVAFKYLKKLSLFFTLKKKMVILTKFLTQNSAESLEQCTRSHLSCLILSKRLYDHKHFQASFDSS